MAHLLLHWRLHSLCENRGWRTTQHGFDPFPFAFSNFLFS
jgi:hypothetical protein